MKKILSLFLVLLMICSLVACTNKDENTDTSTPDTEQSTPAPTEPFETTPDNGEVEYEKNYTMKEVLEIKTNWQSQYAFPCDTDKVEFEEETDTKLKMSLKTSSITYEKTVEFYDKYTANKENKNKTTTLESCFYSFEEEYVTRTIMIVKNKDNVKITIEYSMENVNKR